MPSGGWVKLYRKLMGNGFYRHSAYVHLWIHLLLEANHEPKEFLWNGKPMTVESGQFITGRTQLIEETGIPGTTIERILNYFENEQQIGQQKTTKFRLISILNWPQYQQTDNKTDNRWTTDGHKQEGKNKELISTNVDILSSKHDDVKSCPHLLIIKLYREYLPMCADIDADTWTDTRGKNLRARWREKKERQNLGWWESFFKEVSKSPFLTGRKTGKDGRAFFAHLDWLVKPENFAKVLEGRYHE